MGTSPDAIGPYRVTAGLQDERKVGSGHPCTRVNHALAVHADTALLDLATSVARRRSQPCVHQHPAQRPGRFASERNRHLAQFRREIPFSVHSFELRRGTFRGGFPVELCDHLSGQVHLRLLRVHLAFFDSGAELGDSRLAERCEQQVVSPHQRSRRWT